MAAAAPHTEPEVQPLSRAQRAKGKQRYYLYGFFNSVSYAVLAEGMVILVLLRLGGTEAWVGAVSSLMYLTLPFMVVGYLTIPRLGVSGTAGAFWLLRSLSALPMIAAPWVAVTVGGQAALWSLALGAGGFMLGRAGGMVAFTGIITELTTPADRGDLIAGSFKLFQTGAILVTVAVAVFLGDGAPLLRYQLFFTVGLVSGVIASTALWSIPEAGLFRAPAPFSLRAELRWVLATRGRRWFFAMMAAIPVSQGLLRTFLIVLAKQGYGLSDQVAVLLVLGGMLGGIAASYSYGLFLDQLGSRPLLVLTGFLDIAATVLVVVQPAAQHLWLLALVFVLSGYAHTALQAATQHYFISITSREHQLPQGILTQGAGGLAAGATLYAAGAALGAIKLQTAGAADPLLHFRWFFAGVLALLLLRTVILFAIPPLRSQGIRDSLNALLSPWDWRAIHAVKRAVSGRSEDEEARALAVMQRSTAGVYQADLLRYLDAPSLFVRGRALDTLFRARPTPELIERLRHDVRVNEYTTAHQAAYWLGRWKVEAALPDLRAALVSPDFRLSGSAIHALVEMDDRESLPVVEAALAMSTNPYLIIEGGRAVSIWGDERLYPLLLQKYHLDIPPQAKAELSLSVARLLGLYDMFYRDLGMFNREPAQLLRDWQERLASRDSAGLIAHLRAESYPRDALLATLRERHGAYHGWFRDVTEPFLERRPAQVLREVAFLMTFLLLVDEGRHSTGA